MERKTKKRGEKPVRLDLVDKKRKSASGEKPLADLLFWRRGRDSNPRAIARKLISSQPRYDHFDTSPCISTIKNPQKTPCKMRRKDGEKTSI